MLYHAIGFNKLSIFINLNHVQRYFNNCFDSMILIILIYDYILSNLYTTL